MNLAIVERYRCPEEFLKVRLSAPLSNASRFFRFGNDIICYGQSCLESDAARSNALLCDMSPHVRAGRSELLLPFNPTEVIDNLRCERYVGAPNGLPANDATSFSKHLYYFIRRFLPTSLRRHLQRIYFRGFDKMSFPHWPLDVTVENLLEKLLVFVMQASGVEAIPFIWFWPDGAASAAIVTHDVETASGRDFCAHLMDIDEAFGIPSSFQIVPEGRYSLPPGFLDKLRSRGYEINIHDLNHDGGLFGDRGQFLTRIKAVNQYGRAFGARGFRSAMLYRNVQWFDELDFEYDMSVPNIGHLELQRGGCCSVFPYFIGDILQIPVTATQDYSLFFILRNFTLDLWKAQAAGIAEKHGLLSFIAHPDYLQEVQARDTYRGLLAFLSQCRSEQGMWITTPGEINKWWRQRSQMKLVCHDGIWQIHGSGRERAQIAYARAVDEKVVYTREGSPVYSARSSILSNA